MSKFRVTMDLDFGELSPEALQNDAGDLERVEEAFKGMILSQARSKSITELHDIRKDQDMDLDVRAIRMAEKLLKIKATLMAEANLKVERLPGDAEIGTELPFEKRYRQAA